MSATPTGSGGDFSLILTRGLRPLAMIWHPYGMLQNGMLRIRFFLQKICVNLRNLRLKTSLSPFSVTHISEARRTLIF